MGSFSVAHWVIVLVVVLILFGRGRIAETMGEFGTGIRSFRKGLKDGEKADAAGPASDDTTMLQVRSEIGSTPIKTK